MGRYDDTHPVLIVLAFLVIAAINVAWIGVLIWAIVNIVQWLVAQ